MHKFLFLDFDGVLFNTVDEAYNVCINTQSFKNYQFNDEHLLKFRALRPIIGPAWNYYYVMNYLIGILANIEHSTMIKTDDALSFQMDFFETRKHLKKNNYKKWLQLNSPYDFLFRLECILANKKDLKVLIVTTKDKSTVKDLLNEFNIKYIEERHILCKDVFEVYKSKRNVIEWMLSKTDNKYKALFVDDLYEHLDLCSDINHLELLQPDWGYIEFNCNSSYLKNMEDILTKINLI